MEHAHGEKCLAALRRELSDAAACILVAAIDKATTEVDLEMRYYGLNRAARVYSIPSGESGELGRQFAAERMRHATSYAASVDRLAERFQTAKAVKGDRK
jgi:hypothetical protein